jgi:hypothetical protein
MKEIKVLSLHSPFDWRKPKRYLCFLIRFITRSYWNHSAILANIDGIDQVVEADIDGVVKIPFEEYKQNGVIKLSEKTYQVDWERISKHIGVAKYDYRNLFFHQALKEIFGIYITPKPGRKGEKFVCSELVAYALKKPEPWSWTPRQISEL